MELKYKDMLKALAAIEDERKIPEEDLKEALKEALAKAYKKDAELSDINVEVEINEKSQTIDIYQLYNVVENVEDDELEIELPEARELKPDAILGDVIRRKVEITGMSRAAALLARNVIRQKIREAEKIAVYNAYIDQLDEMVIGIVETVKEKFTLVNLGKTIAMMPKSNQIPNEHLTEGQKIRVVITEVNTDTKGSQVLVSRASPMLVKRLFEKEVPEISQGIVEIKAIAREAGERTKMAVVSYNPDIDPTGACIGQRGARVQEIIEELKGEKIDIFQWSEDFTVLVKNALAPAEIINVLPGPEDHSLTVIVDDDQLSLAIGKKGKNARLAVKLTGRKIDIKTRADIEATYGDYDKFVAEAEVRKEELQRQISQREIARMEAEKKAADEKRQAAIEELARRKADEAAAAAAAEDVLPEEMQEMMSERIRNEMAHETHPAETPVQETPAIEEDVSEPEAVAEEAAPEVTPEPAAEEPKEEPVEEPAAAKEPKKKKVDLEEIAAKHEYVSKFEKFADTSKPKPAAPVKKRRKKGDDDGIKTRNDELLKQLTGTTEIVKPVYTEEELDEIERQQQEEEYSKYDDIDDYDEYEEYYDN
ncbi:MAG: transcription termination/antitermination protein NusA [Solobacterium sp.]|nr:transcription termination/antitermination protein NusA [Solobacterium sp.]